MTKLSKVMVIFIGNEISNTSSNPSWSSLHFTNAFEKGMNPFILPTAMDKQDRLIFFSWLNKSIEGKLWIQTSFILLKYWPCVDSVTSMYLGKMPKYMQGTLLQKTGKLKYR